jgi:hypothetical protein
MDCCRVCYLYETNPKYRALWDLPNTGGPAVRRGNCVHRGADVRTVKCPTCRGEVQIKVFACALHQECTLAKAVHEIACCQTCQDFEPELSHA